MTMIIVMLISHSVFEDKLGNPYLCRFTWQESIQADVRFQVLQSWICLDFIDGLKPFVDEVELHSYLNLYLYFDLHFLAVPRQLNR